MKLKNIPLSVTSSDYLICSFPRSGNTWMRKLISDVLQQNAGFDTSHGLIIHDDNIIPTFEHHDIDARIHVPHRLIKSHSSYQDDFKNALYLVRRAEDCLVSYYYFKLRYDHTKEEALRDGIDAFCVKRIESWREHIYSWLTAKKTCTAKIFIMTFESLISDTCTALEKALLFLHIPTTTEIIEKAVQNQSFARLQNCEKERTSAHTAVPYVPFFRKGAIGSAREELTDSTYQHIRKNTDALYNEVCKSLFV